MAGEIMVDRVVDTDPDYLDTIGDSYPPEYVAPETKERPQYGVQYAKAMYATSNRLGTFHFDEIEYMGLMEIAQGRQSVEGIRKLFGHFDEGDSQGADLAYIDPQVLNLAPKYINRAVAKMQRYTYDIGVNAVDIVSVNEKEQLAAGIQAFYRLKDWLEGMGQDPRELFPDIDVDALPQYPDEMLYDLTANPKIKKEIAAELGIKLLHYVNDFRQKLREVDWYTVVIGKGHLHFYLDENGVPRVEVINPRFYVGSYVDNESYDNQQHAGFIDWITVDQLRKEMLADGFDEYFIQDIVAQWRDGRHGSISPEYKGGTTSYDGLDYVPVMRFYFKSEDVRTFVKQKNKYGTEILLEKSFNYEPGPEVYEYFNRGEREVIRNQYTSVYGGTWIINTDVVYNYGRKKTPRTHLVEAQLPIISFAPNMKEGRVVSLLSQMIEPLFMINVSWNKIKEILAKGWMGTREIDISQFENVALGKGGHEWTPRQVYEHFLKTNTLIKRSHRNQYDQNPNGSAVVDSASGLQMADYINTLMTAINMLEQMTSTAAVDSINVPDRLSATGAKLSAMTSDFDMEYLYNAHEFFLYKGSHMLLLLLQETLRDGNTVKGFIPALGKVNTGYYEAPTDLAYCDLGLMITRQPTDEEWAQFYEDVRIALANKEISVADSAFLRDIDNLKQARQMLVIRHNQHRRYLREEAEFNNKLAIESNQAAAEAKAQFEAAKEDKKGENARELALLDGKIKERLIRVEKGLEAEIKGVENQIKERMKRQEGIDSIVKEAMRAKADKYGSDMQFRQSVINATQKAESDRMKAIQATQKAQSKPKPIAKSKNK